MNLVICVAQYKNEEQWHEFVRSVDACKTPTKDNIWFITVNTDADERWWGPLFLFGKRDRSRGFCCQDRPRQYASVMYEKIKAAAPYCDDDTIAWLADPDYACNPYALEFAHMIMTENPEVDYLCLLKEPGLADKSLPRIKLSGFNFVKYPSMMGGAMMVRWKPFYPVVQEFFKEYGVTGEDSGRAGGFDQAYWRFLTGKRGGDNKHVYMLDEWTLTQHCNTISNYLKSKGSGGVRSHMYGLDMDERVSPFKFREVLERQNG